MGGMKISIGQVSIKYIFPFYVLPFPSRMLRSWLAKKEPHPKYS
jgi:antibiotic biosynthesis monooxygenase (ABM) superfamily enzyme